VNRRLSDCCVDVRKKLIDAMLALERGRAGIALVVDGGKLLGVLTDGNIRRALLDGKTTDSPLEPHIHRNFSSVDPGASRSEVLELMQARVISQVPVVDDAGQLQGLHLMRELLGSEERPNWALIMCGGVGLRLRPLTEKVPKPMLRVAGKPILERIVLHLIGFGIRRIFLAVHYLPEMIEDYFGNGERFGCRIEYLREEKPLGTGGALSLLPARPTSTLLALNGDLITQFDVGRLIAFHEGGSFPLSVGMREHTYTVPFGVAETRGDHIVSIQEKPTVGWRTNAGVYAISPHLLERVPRETEFPMPGLIADCLSRNEPVGAFEIEGDWIDVGRGPELERARGLLGEKP
jgi:dTDP-glucose pyrophosphorylase